MAESFTSSDEIVISVSAALNTTIVENNNVSQVTYILTNVDFSFEKPVALINSSNQMVMIAGNKYCSTWVFSDSNLFEMFTSAIISDDGQKLFDVRYSN